MGLAIFNVVAWGRYDPNVVTGGGEIMTPTFDYARTRVAWECRCRIQKYSVMNMETVNLSLYHKNTVPQEEIFRANTPVILPFSAPSITGSVELTFLHGTERILDDFIKGAVRDYFEEQRCSRRAAV